MSLNDAAKKSEVREHNVKTRRRGAELEAALLDAAWAELLGGGYSAFTIEGVAVRARPSRPVIARRWTSRGDLALAAFRHQLKHRTLNIPDESDNRPTLTTNSLEPYKRNVTMVTMMLNPT